MSKINSETLKYFADVIERETGIIYVEENYFQLEDRVLQLCRNASIEDPSELALTLHDPSQARLRRTFIDIATNNETSFFRDPGIFQVIKNTVLPLLVERGGAKLSFWSAAGSTGQEVYSLIMAIEESGLVPLSSMSVHMTDISERVLERAQQGIYTQLEVSRGLSPERLSRFFDPSPFVSGEYRIKEHIRRLVSFSRLNFLESFADMGQFDLVLCRNVLIYLALQTMLCVA